MKGERFRSFVIALAAIASLAAFAIYLSEQQRAVDNNRDSALVELADATANIAREIGDLTGVAFSKVDSLVRLLGTGIVRPSRRLELIELLVGHLESAPSVLFIQTGTVSGSYTTAERISRNELPVVGVSVQGEAVSWFETSDQLSPIAHTESFDPRTETWYLVALDVRGTSWSYGTSHYLRSGEVLIVSSPIFDAEGALLGVVSAGIEIAAIETLLDSYVSNNGVWCEILDGEGRVVFASRGSPASASSKISSETDRITMSRPVEGSNPGWNLIVSMNAPRALDPPDFAIGALIGIACIASIGAASISTRLRREKSAGPVEASHLEENALTPVLASITKEIASVLDSSQLIEFSPGLSKEQRRYADQTTSAADRAMSLLLEMRTSIESHEPPSFDLRNLVSELASHLEKTLNGATRISTNFAHLPSLTRGWQTIGDPTIISQTITQLVANAKAAMPEGGVIAITVSQSDYTSVRPIRCSVCGRAITGDWNRVDVTDGGVGIPQTFIHRIFEPNFTQIPNGRSGLGLSQVAGAIKKIGGHVLVDSTPEVGSTFSLFLPRTADRG